MKKRTKAQRSAAAKLAWARRRGDTKTAPVSTGLDVQKLVRVTRHATHGDFGLNAEVSQRIKAVYEWAMQQEGSSDLTAIQKEVLDFMASKIGRVLSGKADHVDHWDDLAGYPTLVANHLRG